MQISIPFCVLREVHSSTSIGSYYISQMYVANSGERIASVHKQSKKGYVHTYRCNCSAVRVDSVMDVLRDPDSIPVGRDHNEGPFSKAHSLAFHWFVIQGQDDT